jgi:hypothetical protein
MKGTLYLGTFGGCVVMSGCFPEKTLRRFLDATLLESQAEAVAQHLGDCAVCQEVLEQLTRSPDARVPGVVGPSRAPADRTADLDFLQALKNHPPHPSPAAAPLPDDTNAGPEPPGPAGAPPAIPGYEILGELGRGGMGVVYKARQVKLDRLVALKVIWGGARAEPSLLARFRLEAEALARLQHPNIVQVYDVGEQDSCPYLALEYVDAGSLDQQLSGKPLPARTAARLMATVAGAVHAAHQAGVLHRDLKPANILVSGGVVSGERSPSPGAATPGLGHHPPLTTHHSPPPRSPILALPSAWTVSPAKPGAAW